jgi:GNAT superfamily N-acetyltransferase
MIGVSRMISYNVERLTEELLEELQPLLEAHWEEIAMHKDKIVFDPDYEAYLAMQENEAVQSVIVRDDGKIIGYYISFIYTHPHYKNNKFSQNDVLYVDPSKRGGTVAYRMLKFAEKELKALGISVMTLHMKTAYPFERLCESVGMSEIEKIYSKYIGE